MRRTAIVDRLKDKVALITGASSGIGRRTGLRFAEEGARVVAVDRNQRGGEETVRLIGEQGGAALFLQCDTSKAQQIETAFVAAVSHFGRLDVLVNAAAVLIRAPQLAEIDEQVWDTTMDTNLKGVFLCCKYAVPHMLRSGGGSIINIASGSGIRGAGVALPYAVSKAGVIHLTTTAAAQYTPQGIRINCISPGPTDTPQMRGSTASLEGFQARQQSHPMGRVGRPEEIANAILFLASDEASFVSGATFIVDGGQRASS